MTDDQQGRATRGLKMALFFVFVLAGTPVGSIDWYWLEGAQLDFMQPGDFFGDDFISDVFIWLFNYIIRPVWNFLFGIEAIRVLFAALYVGFMGALGAGLYKLAREKLID
jgi:hypothetical protein